MNLDVVFFGAAVVLLAGELLALWVTRENLTPPTAQELNKVDRRCPKCGNRSVYWRGKKQVCEQCGVVE